MKNISQSLDCRRVLLSLCFGLSVAAAGLSSDSRFVLPELDEARDRAEILV